MSGSVFAVREPSRKGLSDKWVSVTTAWRVLRLRMEERPPILRVAANILNKQSWAADKGWSSSLEVGRGADNRWRTEGGLGGSTPPPRNSEGPPKSCQTQPDCENC